MNLTFKPLFLGKKWSRREKTALREVNILCILKIDFLVDIYGFF